MANHITSTSRLPVEFGIKSKFRTVVDGCAGFVERLNAAIVVARAVENRRTPSRRDLNILGIDCDLPRF